MGYRAMQIFKSNPDNISVICRANQSYIRSPHIKYPFRGFQLYSRLIQLIFKLLGNTIIYRFLRMTELHVFELFAKTEIRKFDIIHFFQHSHNLIQYANSIGKITVIEGFTHPLFVKKLNNEGLTLDDKIYNSDDHSILCYRDSKYIISPSKWVSQSLIYASIDKSKIKEIYYGVHYHKDREYIEGLALRIIFAGGVKRTKGIIELIRAVNELKHLKLELNIFGRQYFTIKEEVTRLIKGNNNIKIHGFSKNIIDQYYENDLYILPSYFEGSSKTIFEAMSCGLPVITTPNSGSIVRNGVDGFIVPAGDMNAIVEKIKIFYFNRDKIIEMGSKAQKFTRSFTWEGYGNKVNEFYEFIIQK